MGQWRGNTVKGDFSHVVLGEVKEAGSHAAVSGYGTWSLFMDREFRLLEQGLLDKGRKILMVLHGQSKGYGIPLEY